MSESLSQKAYDIILERILDNRLPAGEIINRREVATELGISVAPVLEAMLMLEQDGLLETLPRKITRVTIIRSEDVAGHLFVREALECYVARQVCGRLVSQAEDRLFPLASQADHVPHPSMQYARADFTFHSVLVGLFQCNLLDKEYERVSRLGFFYRINRFISPTEATVRFSHEQLLKQLKTDDPDYAQRCMRDHLISGKGHLALSRG